MSEPLTPDEVVVLREFTRLDVEPNEIPAEIFEGFLEKLAGSCNISLERARLALQGLIDKGVFDSMTEGPDEPKQNEREIIRDLLFHDPEVQEHLKKIIADICKDRK